MMGVLEAGMDIWQPGINVCSLTDKTPHGCFVDGVETTVRISVYRLASPSSVEV